MHNWCVNFGIRAMPRRFNEKVGCTHEKRVVSSTIPLDFILFLIFRQKALLGRANPANRADVFFPAVFIKMCQKTATFSIYSLIFWRRLMQDSWELQTCLTKKCCKFYSPSVSGTFVSYVVCPHRWTCTRCYLHTFWCVERREEDENTHSFVFLFTQRLYWKCD